MTDEHIAALLACGISLRHFSIGCPLVVEAPSRLVGSAYGSMEVGAFSYVNGAEIFNARIGRFCSIAGGVIIGPGEHPIDWLSSHPFVLDRGDTVAGLSSWPPYAEWVPVDRPLPARSTRRAKTTIGHDVWIGARAIILQGVNVGDGAIVAASAVVTQDVEPYAIVGGIPARRIRYRFGRRLRARLQAARWWRYDLGPLAGTADFSDVHRTLSAIEGRIATGQLQVLKPQTFEIGDGIVSEREPIAWPVEVPRWRAKRGGLRTLRSFLRRVGVRRSR